MSSAFSTLLVEPEPSFCQQMLTGGEGRRQSGSGYVLPVAFLPFEIWHAGLTAGLASYKIETSCLDILYL